MKKVLAIFMVIITLSLCSCSKESKFGIQQFVERMNESFETDYTTNEFMLSEMDDEQVLFMTRKSYMLSLTLDDDTNIRGISILITDEADVQNAIITYVQLCSVLTGNDYESQLKIFDETSFLSDNIKFADGNSLITVGRYKYTVVCNEYAITLFCEKI